MKVVHEFLEPQQHAELVRFAIAFQYEEAKAGGTVNDYRRARVAFKFDPHQSLLRDRIREMAPDLMRELSPIQGNVDRIEAQLTAHNDGHYYRAHRDIGTKDTMQRFVSYVYYFWREPKGFTGGDLVFHEAVKTRLVPINNSIVFFPSHHMHEVEQVNCPSREFADSRFTINGWIRQ